MDLNMGMLIEAGLFASRSEEVKAALEAYDTKAGARPVAITVTPVGAARGRGATFECTYSFAASSGVVEVVAVVEWEGGLRHVKSLTERPAKMIT